MISTKDIDQLTAASGRAPSERFTLALYAVTLFLSALLIFAIQPMFTKMVLPKLGGSPSVWSVAMVVFQTALFIGYVYAHLLARTFKPGWAALIHLAFLASVAATLPLGIARGFGTAPEQGVSLWLAGLFFASIGFPFVALAASAPLLQSWFTSTGHKQAANPYVLYASSNLGSFAALLAYPILIEPLFSLQTQIALWSVGFYALAALIAGTALYASRWTLYIPNLDAEPEAHPSAVQCLKWIMLAAIPSATVIAVTAFISTDVAAAPFLWVMPLALYLLTFVAVFRERPWIEHASIQRLVPYGVAPLVFSAFGGDKALWFVTISVNLLIFMLLALACHGEAYRTRPPHGRLTEFYLSISFGGALGGLFAGLIAPNVFNNTYEYPILLALTLLLLPALFEGGWKRFIREGGPGLVAGTILAILGVIYDVRSLLGNELSRPVFAALLVLPVIVMVVFSRRLVPFFALFVTALLVTRLWVPTEGQIMSVRSFFGVHSVIETADHNYYLLHHGTTVHGAMRIRDAAGNALTQRPEPLSYFYFGGPYSEAIEASRSTRGTLNNVAVIGLGAGTLACHRREAEQWTFFEIDREVVRIARDPKLFRFLSACAPDARIVIGDGRLTLAAMPDKYDLIALDAFSSDAVPVHLLTREAFAGYLSRLNPNGVIVANASNRHMQLVSVLGAVGETAGLIAYVKYDRRKQLDGQRFPAIIVALARNVADLGDLPMREGWQPVISRGVAPWTDDYANLLGAIMREKFGG